MCLNFKNLAHWHELLETEVTSFRPHMFHVTTTSLTLKFFLFFFCQASTLKLVMLGSTISKLDMVASSSQAVKVMPKQEVTYVLHDHHKLYGIVV